MLSMGTNSTSAEPVAPLTDPRSACAEPMPMLASTRGLITVTEAPVSSMRFADPPPLTLADTMMGLPGVKGIFVVVVDGALSPAAGLAGGAGARSGRAIICALARKRSG